MVRHHRTIMLATAAPLDSATLVRDEVFVVGRTRRWTRGDINGLALWMDGDSVVMLTILDYAGRETTFCYSDYTTAKEDHDRIKDGSVRVVLRGESSRAARNRIAAILKATGNLRHDTLILHGRDRGPIL
jgi:hypothetical protein